MEVAFSTLEIPVLHGGAFSSNRKDENHALKMAVRILEFTATPKRAQHENTHMRADACTKKNTHRHSARYCCCRNGMRNPEKLSMEAGQSTRACAAPGRAQLTVLWLHECIWREPILNRVRKSSWYAAQHRCCCPKKIRKLWSEGRTESERAFGMLLIIAISAQTRFKSCRQGAGQRNCSDGACSKQFLAAE